MNEGRRLMFTVPLIILLIITLLTPYVVPHAGPSTTFVATGFYFKGNDASGKIQFTNTVTMYGCDFSDDFVVFINLNAGNRIWSTLGFDCTSNAEVKIDSADREKIVYTVTADSSETSISKIKFPTGTDVYKVPRANTWSYAANVLTVSVYHASDAQIIVYVKPVSQEFNEFRMVWGYMFFLICLVLALGEMERVGEGSLSTSMFLQEIILLAGGSALVFMILSVMEGIV